MSIEEIVHELTQEGSAYEEMIAGTPVTDRIKERWARRVTAMREAIALLRTHPEAQPNEPLTLEELRKMDGEPVWLKTLGEDFEDGWQIAVDVDKLRAHFRQFYAPTFCEDYGNTWVAYRRPPKEYAP